MGNRDSEAYRQRHLQDDGESSGRSESEREVAPKLMYHWRPSLQSKGEGSRTHREMTDAMSPSGGVVNDGMVARMR